MQNHYFGGSNPPVASKHPLRKAFQVYGLTAMLLAGCSGGTPAVPVSHVEWRTVDQPTDRPLAVFVDAPGGPMDLFARDPDVTTFLNDKFDPLLVESFGLQPTGTVAIYTAEGCPLVPPFVPQMPSDWINAANRAILRPEAQGRHAASAAPGACKP